MRCLYLESQGYSVTVTELVGWEHSLKNELIIARYNGHKKRSAATRLQALLAQFGLQHLLPLRYPRLADLPALPTPDSAPEPASDWSSDSAAA